jgi:hypothetical protein
MLDKLRRLTGHVKAHFAEPILALKPLDAFSDLMIYVQPTFIRLVTANTETMVNAVDARKLAAALIQAAETLDTVRLTASEH